ncbi:arginine--tRNA ligase [Plebeiibacterium sediminum]|uniref:Arginine--tRNA ligase n=1 Tax=Plebeiibacterium sediminum TaxID=2992112 RepID=A0AAE3M2M8_9BACT|nr:arginine--tRNA ligase [Plebeiobacterium sediminum]MCW3785712.1 arginine--tRNA ligase [Plebeiobacterium sediminum]
MDIELQLKGKVIAAVKELYGQEINENQAQVQITRKDLTGDFTIVVFPLLKISKKSPEDTGNDIGEFIKNSDENVANYNVVKGFLNIELAADYWLNLVNDIAKEETYGYQPVEETSPLMMIEYSSPNTNKPLHLGHIRNNLLGYSLSRIAGANGYRVVKTNIVNDRGIHICKSMLAWKKWGEGATPESTGIKGDKLVGDYYVKFDQEYKAEIKAIIAEKQNEYAAISDAADFSALYSDLKAKKKTKEGLNDAENEQFKACEELSKYAENNAPLILEAREMLRKWEAKDAEVYKDWETMNGWVYAGFDVTYKKLGVDFDKIYYESDTFTVGRDMVLEGLDKGLFYRRDDNSVWCNLADDGLDEKLLLRKDGTSVYMTQDIGTAKLRYDDFNIDKMVYVVGNEQDYHFQVLALLLDKLGFKWGKDLVHFSYGMVELPEGKMKSREGTVVDADDLVDEMVNTAREMSKELGKLEGYSEEEAESVFRMIALGALKYFILKVDPRKNMTFNPSESIDFNGNTGPFIQYTHARIQSIFRKAAEKGIEVADQAPTNVEIGEKENNLIRMISNFPNIVKEAGKVFSPAIIANFVYDLAKEYNQFYHDYPILFEEDENKRMMRLVLCKTVGKTIKNAMWLLGVDVPEKM